MTATDRRSFDPPDRRNEWLPSATGRTLVTRLLGLVATAPAVAGPALAHTGHDGAHAGSGGILLPAALVIGSALVIGASLYLARTGDVDGRVARMGVLLGIVGLFLGVLNGV